jgi:TPR repeat protein
VITPENEEKGCSASADALLFFPFVTTQGSNNLVKPRSVSRVSLLVLALFLALAAVLFLVRSNQGDTRPEARKHDAASQGDRALRQNAEQGSAPDQYLLGAGYLYGRNVAKDVGEAATWLRKAAAQGNADAQALLGEMYASGTGVAKDPIAAVTLFRKAAAQQNDRGLHDLGFAYETGFGVPPDPTEALEWYRKVRRDPRTTAALERLAAAERR